MIHRPAMLAALILAAAPLAAETLAIDGQVSVRESNIERPSRGMTMHQVEARFGAPSNRRAAVGQPPITRWEYGNFTVVFENDRVLHAVVNPTG
ncbi:MAG: phosphodiesterase [Pseudomonadales bacterium]|nr:phosphodiesterase [Pseudomonadales bacterium]